VCVTKIVRLTRKIGPTHNIMEENNGIHGTVHR
jgi:hypothetical protein